MPDQAYYATLWLLFSKVFTASLLLPVAVALLRRKYLNRPLILFLCYCVTTFLLNLLEQTFIWVATHHFDLIEPFVSYWKIADTNFLNILFFLKEFLFLGWFYGILLPPAQGVWVKRIAVFLSAVVLLNYLFIEGYRVYGVFNPAVNAIFDFGLPLFYLWYLYRSYLNMPVSKNPYVWFSFGLIFINILGLFMYFAGAKIFQTDYALFAKLSIGRNCLGMIGQVLFSIGFWYAPYVKYLSPSPENEANSKRNGLL